MRTTKQDVQNAYDRLIRAMNYHGVNTGGWELSYYAEANGYNIFTEKGYIGGNGLSANRVPAKQFVDRCYFFVDALEMIERVQENKPCAV